MQNKAFSTWFIKYQQQALMLNERRLIVLQGSNAWTTTLLDNIESFNEQKRGDKVWLVFGESGSHKANVTKQRVRDKLGSESDFVIFQDPDFSIDALACLSGTLVAGGVFFLIIEDYAQVKQSLFKQRFFHLLSKFPEHVLLKQQHFSLPSLNNNQAVNIPTNVFVNVDKHYNHQCITQSQLTAVEAVIKVFDGKRHQPLVLTADRGRGKSSALAIGCAALLTAANRSYQRRLIITAANINALSVFFNRLQMCLPNSEFQQGKLTTLHGSVEFIPIDQLLKEPIKASLVLVDEAAAIPIYLLDQLLLNHARLVFSTTVHGYEGAGRGFTLKFQRTLAAKFPKWQSVHLNEPIRWGLNDPLEQLIFDACLLNAELPSIMLPVPIKDMSSFMFTKVNAAELASNEALFQQVVAVLVTAHYQTKPSDIKLILDNKRVQLVCLISQNTSNPQVVAVALLINEGNHDESTFDAKNINAIKESKRRLKNNFVPQSLLTQCGFEEAFEFSYLRIMRIAVHPQIQHQGIGRYFLGNIEAFAKSQQIDFIASSFGASKPLLSFWLTSNFRLARIGFTKDKASGEQSALVLKSLSNKANKTLNSINLVFYRSFDYLLTDEYKYLPAKLVLLILQYSPALNGVELNGHDKGNVLGFSLGYRQYSSCVFSLHLWLKLTISSSVKNGEDELQVLINRVFQKQSIAEICTTYGFTGKKALEQFIRSKVIQLQGF